MAHRISLGAAACGLIIVGCGEVSKENDALVVDQLIVDAAMPDRQVEDARAPDSITPDIQIPDKGGLKYVEIHTGVYHACARRSDGKIVCWGGNPVGKHPAAKGPTGTFLAFDSGSNHNCGIRSDNSIHCWGQKVAAVTQQPTGTKSFAKIACGSYHCCALTSTDKMTCWGDNTFKQATAPAGTYSFIASGVNSNCAIDTSGNSACWGQVAEIKTKLPPDTFSMISVDLGNTACGIVKGSKTLKCWGKGVTSVTCLPSKSNQECGQGIPPSGTFKDVSAGFFNSCGVKTDGTAVCWGKAKDGLNCDPDHDQDKFDCGQGAAYKPPSGVAYEQVDLAKWHSCGLLSTGMVKCWGWSKYKQDAVPPLTSGP